MELLYTVILNFDSSFSNSIIESVLIKVLSLQYVILFVLKDKLIFVIQNCKYNKLSLKEININTAIW